ncbi:hypothetical protein [Nocardia concava]|uniref:hypothetical protein n=1 Tax=Nocardia concava TaxID=257281 RepID=UPI0002D287D1|nr:hypothetical protein [Nocardia concava]
MLDEGGFTRPDDGAEDLIPYTDRAYMYLVMTRNVLHDEAERAIEGRWPSVAADESEDWSW